MFSIDLQRAEETRRYSVSTCADGGWEITKEENQMRTSRTVCHDWHRVELRIARLRLEMATLAEAGWRVQSTNR